MKDEHRQVVVCLLGATVVKEVETILELMLMLLEVRHCAMMNYL